MIGCILKVSILILSTRLISASECQPEPHCFCIFDGEKIPVAQNDVTNEALAAAVGAMSSTALIGSGLFAWKLCKRKGNSSKEKRNNSASSASARSTNSSGTKEPNKGPAFKPYSEMPRKKPALSSPSPAPPEGRPVAVSQMNVYRAAVFNSARASSRAYDGAVSDWS